MKKGQFCMTTSGMKKGQRRDGYPSGMQKGQLCVSSSGMKKNHEEICVMQDKLLMMYRFTEMSTSQWPKRTVQL